MLQNLNNYIAAVTTEFDQIADDRKTILAKIATFVAQKQKVGETANLILICTHNSRRSHLSQVWTQVAAHYYGFKNVFGYSGGTEATALFPSAAKALAKAGLQVTGLSDGKNPVYSIKYAENEPAIICFSKTYEDAFNPQSGFAAIMTCNHADANCPFIPTAEQRISLPFNDPKAFDGTAQQEEKYDERCRDIARELLYAFSLVNTELQKA
jgi:arsenate reductase (thioredoxin)